MLRWYPSVLLRVVLELTYVPVVFMTVFALKVLVDPETPWSIGPWEGPGASPDFLKFVVLLVLGWTLLVRGWRGAKAAFKVGIVLWHFAWTAVSVAFVLAAGDPVLRGEAIGFSMSLGVIAPVFSLTALVCALVWVTGDSRESARKRSVSPLQRRNKLAGLLAVLGLGLAAAAFALGFDELATILGIAASLAGHEVMRPVNPSAELHKALVGEGSALE